MMLSFLLAMILNFIPNFAFHYKVGPYTYSEAKAYCKSIGTYMATIVDVGDRVEALAAIKFRQEAWIGLEHVLVPELTYCYWHYPEESDPNKSCPVKRDCVGFWVNGSPIKVERGGNECALYYSGLLNGDGGVNNDVDCNTGKRAVLCHEDPPDQCDIEDFTCYKAPFPGIEWCHSGDRGAFGIGCFCDFDANDESVCVSNYWCSKQPKCKKVNGNSECAPGSVCVIGTCCSKYDTLGGQCTPLCGEDTERRILVEEVDDGPSCVGVYVDGECPP